MISSPPSKARRALCLFSYGIYADKFLFSGVTQSLPLTGEVARQRRDGGGVVYIHDKNCIIKLQTALSTTSWSPSPVSGRLADPVRKHTAKQEFEHRRQPPNSVYLRNLSKNKFQPYFPQTISHSRPCGAMRGGLRDALPSRTNAPIKFAKLARLPKFR